MSFAAFGRNHDHRYVFRVRHPGKLLDKFQTVHDRHVDVTKDQINSLVLEYTQGVGPVSGFEYLRQVDARLTQRGRSGVF